MDQIRIFDSSAYLKIMVVLQIFDCKKSSEEETKVEIFAR